MVDIEKPEFTPLLPPGPHEMDVAEVRKLAVTGQAKSPARETRMTLLEDIVRQCETAEIDGEIWVGVVS